MKGARPSLLNASLVLALTVFCPTAPAQNAAGRIFGTVTDQSGAAIVGATITVTNEDTHREYPAVTGADGFYQLVLLPIGTYRLTAERDAIQALEQPSIELVLKESRHKIGHSDVG